MKHPTRDIEVEKIGDVFRYQENGETVMGAAYQNGDKWHGVEWTPNTQAAADLAMHHLANKSRE